MIEEVGPLDESFTHQIVAPKRAVVSDHPKWAERAYFLVSLPGGGVVNAGRQLYTNAGRRFAFVAGRRGSTIVTTCASAPFGAADDDPDAAEVGPIRIEVLEPLRALRIRTLDPDAPLAVDLTYEARFPAVTTDVNRIELGGEVVTEYMNFFQSGRYSGIVTVDGGSEVLDDRLGFRDRGWGFRKHEGANRRGLQMMVGCELADWSLYLLLYETAQGRRAFTNGWLIDRTGVFDRVASAEHDLEWGPAGLIGGRFDVTTATGRRLELDIRIRSHLYLSTVGYRREGHVGLDGHRRHDLDAPEALAAVLGQTDSSSEFMVDGEPGYGYTEFGLGEHDRYNPPSA